MTIVSQNKEKAKKYNNIITISYDNDYETKEEFWIVFIDGEDMGHYKTRERAKEVLQKILDTYTKSKVIRITRNMDIQDKLIDMLDVADLRFDIYEMPEE